MPRHAFQRVDLDNGLRLAVAPMPDRDSVSAGLWVGIGGRHESARLCGISHFLEHMVFKGTRRRSSLEISREIEGRGGYINAFTGEESTCYYTRTARDHLEVSLDVLLDLYRGARIKSADLERERGVILEEVYGVLDAPSQYVQERLNGVLWPDHPLGRPLEGTPASVRRIRRDDLLKFRRTAYVLSNSVLAVAGAVDTETATRLARRLTRGLAAGRQPRWRRFPNRVRAPVVDVVRQDTEQTHVAIGFRAFSRRDPRRYAARILSVILGENMSSRLFQVVREEEGLAYDIHTSTSFLADTGAFVISAGLKNDRLESGLALIGRELRRTARRCLSREELQRARDYATGQFRLSMEGTSHRMTYLGEHVLAFDALPDPDRAVHRFSRLEPSTVRSGAADLFRRGRLALAIVGPVDPARASRLVGCLGVS